MSRTPIFTLPPFRVHQVYSTGALTEQIDWGLRAFGIPDHWENTQGEGVLIGNCDTGTLPGHEDLRDNLVDAKDFTGSRKGANDVNGHGVHTQSIHSAAKNGRGIVGVAPKSRFVSAKVLGDNGYGTDKAVADGVDWCVEKGCHIISMSLGSPDDSPLIVAAIRRAVEARRWVVCAAGNSGRRGVDSPGRMPETIAVAATDENGHIADFSGRGMQVDIAAPGVNIVGAWHTGGYARLSGTSQATPFVVGVLALMLSRHLARGNPILSTDELREHLRRTAKDAGAPGRDDAFGWGLIDPINLIGKDEPKPADTGINIGIGTLHIPARAGDWFSVGGGK